MGGNDEWDASRSPFPNITDEEWKIGYHMVVWHGGPDGSPIRGFSLGSREAKKQIKLWVLEHRVRINRQTPQPKGACWAS